MHDVGWDWPSASTVFGVGVTLIVLPSPPITVIWRGLGSTAVQCGMASPTPTSRFQRRRPDAGRLELPVSIRGDDHPTKRQRRLAAITSVTTAHAVGWSQIG